MPRVARDTVESVEQQIARVWLMDALPTRRPPCRSSQSRSNGFEPTCAGWRWKRKQIRGDAARDDLRSHHRRFGLLLRHAVHLALRLLDEQVATTAADEGGMNHTVATVITEAVSSMVGWLESGLVFHVSKDEEGVEGKSVVLVSNASLKASPTSSTKELGVRVVSHARILGIDAYGARGCEAAQNAIRTADARFSSTRSTVRSRARSPKRGSCRAVCTV